MSKSRLRTRSREFFASQSFSKPARLTAIAACVAALFLVPGQSFGYSFTLVGHSTGRTYQITPSGVISPGGANTGSYLEAPPVTRSYTFYGSEVVEPGSVTLYPTRYKVSPGGGISASYQKNDSWKSFNSRYYHAIAVSPETGVFARDRQNDLAGPYGYHRLSGNSSDTRVFDIIGDYQLPSGEYRGLASGVDDEFDIPSLSISGVNYPFDGYLDYGLMELKYIRDVSNPVYTNNALGLHLDGKDMTITNGVFEGNGYATVPSGHNYTYDQTILSGYTIEIDNLKYVRNKAPLCLKSKDGSVYVAITNSTFSENTGQAALVSRFTHTGFYDFIIADTSFIGNSRGFDLYEGARSVTITGGEITDNYLSLSATDPGTTLDKAGAGGRTGSLTLNSASVKQNTLRLQGARDVYAYAGGIRASTGTFNHAAFAENAAQAYASAEGSQQYLAGNAIAAGGAISGNTVTLYDATFTDNAAFASGTAKSHAFGGAVQGSITSSGSVSASQATFTRNVASAENSVSAESLAVGGAIASGGGSDTSWIYGQPAYLENSRFVSNTASAFGTRHVAAFGGAFMAEPRRMYALSVLQNTASATTHYSGSQASRYALAIGGGASTGKINFADSPYNAQASQPGGDAPWDEESHHGTISRLLADSGDSDSGQRGNQYKFDSVTFSENKAEARLLTGSNYVGFVERSDYASALGGGWALVFEWSGDVAMSAITLSRNTASALSDGFATPEVNAAAGGGVFRFGESGNKTISGLQVSANLAEATLKASSATSNFRLEANAKAGGLGISGGELKASDTVVFSANKAAATFRPTGSAPAYSVAAGAEGGALYLEYARLSIAGTSSKLAQMTGNTAEAIVTSGARYTYAYARGGAAYLEGGRSSLAITNGVIANNAARALVVSEFVTNARAQGGAFYLEDGTLELTDTNLINNSAESTDPSTLGSEGGGIYAKGQATVIIRAKNKDVRFSDNKANYGSDISMGGNTTLYLDAASGRKITFGGTVHVGGNIKQSGAGTVVLPLAASESNSTNNSVHDWYLDSGRLVTTRPVADFTVNKLVLNGGTVDLRDGGTTTFWIDSLETLSAAPTRLYLDYRGKPASFIDSAIDNIRIYSGVNDSGVAPSIQLSGINIIGDELAEKVSYIHGKDINKIALRTTPLQVQTSSGWRYLFTPDPANPGTLHVSRFYGDSSLPLMFGDEDVDSYSFNSDASADSDLGAMAGPGREFTVFGNGHAFSGGASHTGVSIGEGQTLSVDSLTLKQFGEAAVRNRGTVHLMNAAFDSNREDIINDGDVFLDGGIIRFSRGITTQAGNTGSGRTVLDGANVTFGPGSLLRQKSVVLNSGLLEMEGGSTLEANALNLSGGALLSRGRFTAGLVDVGPGSSLSLLDTRGSMEYFSLNGGTLFLDPAYMGVNALAGDLDGNVYVGSGSVLRIGPAENLERTARDAGLAVTGLGDDAFTVGTDQAVLALGQSAAIASGGALIVDASVTDTGSGTARPAEASAYFGPDSLLVMTARAAQSGGLAGQLSGTLAVADGARLSLLNAVAGRTYTIASGFTGVSSEGSGWTDGNLFVNSYALSATGAFTSDGFTVTTEARDIAEVFSGLIPVSAINTMMADGLNDTDGSAGGIRFLSRAIAGGTYLDKGDVQKTVNEISRIGVTAGVQHTALSSLESSTDAMEYQLSRIQAGSGAASGFAGNWHVWATPFHTRTRTSGMAVSGNSVRDHMTGLAFGAGRAFGSLTAGLSISGADGSARTRGTASGVKDSHRFAGASLYAGWGEGPWNVYGSVGFARGRHKVSAALPDSMAIGSLGTHVRTTALTANVRAEYLLETSALDIIPHAGMRFVSLKTGAHTLSDTASFASDRQNVVEFPVGVALSKSIAAGGWSVRPQVDLTVVPAAGSRKADTRVRFSGISAEDSVRTRVMDGCSVRGLMRISASKQNVSLGLDYAIKASSHETDHSLQARLLWKF